MPWRRSKKSSASPEAFRLSRSEDVRPVRTSSFRLRQGGRAGSGGGSREWATGPARGGGREAEAGLRFLPAGESASERRRSPVRSVEGTGGRFCGRFAASCRAGSRYAGRAEKEKYFEKPFGMHNTEARPSVYIVRPAKNGRTFRAGAKRKKADRNLHRIPQNE